MSTADDNSTMISTLAAVFSLILFPCALYYGFMGRVPLVMVPLAGAFIFAMLFGSGLKRNSNYVDIWDMLLEIVVIGGFAFLGIAAFYFVGYGISAAFYPEYEAAGTVQRDMIAACVVAGISVLLTVADFMTERRDATDANGTPQTGPYFELELSDMRVSPKTIFAYPDHEWHPRTADEAIGKAERALGVRFPDGLRALYYEQNGGALRDVLIPAVRNPRPDDKRDWVNPFPSNREILPLEQLETLQSAAATSHMDLPGAHFSGSQHLVVISEFYGETMLVDCRPNASHQVIFARFYHEDWRKTATLFTDFDALWDALRISADEAEQARRPRLDVTVHPDVLH
ncbi:SMI1/KNR4 family protein [Pseudaestuariivita rosea]|uniref:SMI1/KNR4 family protein n=1 Tax=Pseudaestuariivita rosea TaxID=2763263 RepID=UPI001ABB7BDD|nr:SMI1/KNR4 family protein [Pseudaestuariivita rosea]